MPDLEQLILSMQTNVSRRDAVKLLGAAAAVSSMPAVASGTRPDVYFSDSVSEKSLLELYSRISRNISGRVGLKIHGSEADTNLDLFKALQRSIPNSFFVETNWASDFSGGRANTEGNFAAVCSYGIDGNIVDILDRDGGYTKLAVKNPVMLRHAEISNALANEYGGVIVTANFKTPTFAGFSAAIKNIGVGLASPDGKSEVHGKGYAKDEGFFMRMVESAKTIKERFGNRMVCITFLTGIGRNPVGGMQKATGNIGILASEDPVAIDAAAFNLVWGIGTDEASRLSESEKLRSGYLQIEIAHKIGFGSTGYNLVKI